MIIEWLKRRLKKTIKNEKKIEILAKKMYVDKSLLKDSTLNFNILIANKKFYVIQLTKSLFQIVAFQSVKVN